jgi:transposase
MAEEDIDGIGDLETAKGLLREQRRVIESLVQRIAELEAKMRRGQRQAAPFSKDKRKEEPKKPGQKQGHPPAHREVPQKVDQIVEAKVSKACPGCGGKLIEERVEVQYQVDLPRPIPVQVTQFNVHIATCEACQMRVQGRHAEQTSDALGAAGVQIGPNAIGLGIEMKHGLGVSYGKAARVLSTISTLKIERSTLVRADKRVADKLQPTYQQLMLRLRGSEAVNVDETGWRINADNAWLWVFTNDALSVYVIERSRAHEVAERVLGQDFAGVVGCDCFLAYDPLPYRQNKCAAHLLRRCKELIECKSGRAVKFSHAVAALLREAIVLKKQHAILSPDAYTRACAACETKLDTLLHGRYTDPDNLRFAKLLRKQRTRLLTFLYVDAVQPTNNAAERELRPAVIVRKTNGCNRSDKGAKVHATVTSVLRTCYKQGIDFVSFVAHLLHHPDSLAPPLLS